MEGLDDCVMCMCEVGKPEFGACVFFMLYFSCFHTHLIVVVFMWRA